MRIYRVDAELTACIEAVQYLKEVELSPIIVLGKLDLLVHVVITIEILFFTRWGYIIFNVTIIITIYSC